MVDRMASDYRKYLKRLPQGGQPVGGSSFARSPIRVALPNTPNRTTQFDDTSGICVDMLKT